MNSKIPLEVLAKLNVQVFWLVSLQYILWVTDLIIQYSLFIGSYIPIVTMIIIQLLNFDDYSI